MAFKYSDGSTEASRIAARYRNSGGPGADATVATGGGMNRLFTNVYCYGSQQGLRTPEGLPEGRDILNDFGPDVRGRGGDRG